MTTSGTTSWTSNLTQIVARALRQLGAIAQGETPGSSEFQDAQDALNAMVKEWEASGIHVWTESEAILFFQPNQIQYSLGPGSADHATPITTATSFIQTTLQNNANQGSTSLTLASAANIASGDNIGITMSSNNAFFWTTVSGAPTGNVVALNSPLPGAAVAGGLVVDYATQMQRPLRVINGRRFQFSSLLETPLGSMLSRIDYRELPNKENQGIVNQAFYDPQLSTGYMWVWPAPPDSTYAMKFTWLRQIQDFDTAANTPDFPQEWNNCLTWNLAEQLLPEYDVPEKRAIMISTMAARSLDRVSGWDKEPESVFMGVNFDQTAR